MYPRVEKDIGSNGACGPYLSMTKLKTPAQIQKFCVFLYESVGTPRLRVPDNKVVRALDLMDFLMRLQGGYLSLSFGRGNWNFAIFSKSEKLIMD
jgi:hypothetical protein